MKKFVVLGGYGIIGKAVAADLFKTCKDCEIIIAGRDLKKAKEYASSFNSKKVKAEEVDINNDSRLVRLLKQSDVCVNCIQYYFNVRIMNACLKAETNYVDLGGLFHETKKQLKLDKQFKKIGRTAIPGVGGTPGITNVMAAYGSQTLKKFNSIQITFADKDYTEYAGFVLPYSFRTIVDEYTSKPAVLKNGKMIFATPHSGKKEYDFGKDFGKQRGFYTLHSELATFSDSFKKNGLKNCEFRATFAEDFSKKIIDLVELGLTSKEKVNFGGKDFEILDITSEIMDKFIPKSKIVNDKELIRIYFDGEKLILDAAAKSDGKTSSWILDTGIPCSIAAQMIAKGEIKENGVLAPEKAINPKIFFKELKKRGIAVLKNGKVIS